MKQLLDNTSLDLKPLYQPISEMNVVGVNIRLSPSDSQHYYQLRDLRQQLRRAEREETEEIEKGWQQVIKQSHTLLQKTKDIEIATWLVEGLVREHGLLGFYEGIKLIDYYLETFGTLLQPQPEQGEENKEIIISLLNQFAEPNSPLLAPLNLLSLFSGFDISVWSYKNDRKQGMNALESTHRNLAGIAEETLTQISDRIHLILEELSIIENLINDQFCHESPVSFSVVTEILQEMIYIISQCHKKLPQQVDEGMDLLSSNRENNDYEKSSRAVNSYTEFQHQLVQLAEYMENSQPHSLITVQLVRLARWSTMPMEDVINEMFLDKNLATHVAHNVGILTTDYEEESLPENE